MLDRRSLFLGLTIAAIAALAISLVPSSPIPAAAAADDPPAAQTKEGPDEMALRKLNEEFQRLVEARDARGMAALWTEKGEFVDAAGEVIKGRPAIEKMYADFLKENPKVKVKMQIDSIRLLGRSLAMVEGTISFEGLKDGEKDATQYSALHVREGDSWLTASVRESVVDTADTGSLEDLDWLIGEWRAKSEETEIQTTYTWGDEKAFLQCRYQLTEKGKVTGSGIQILAEDPATGELRAWLFDRSGTLGESTWVKDGGRWTIEASGTLPDGSETTAVNLLVLLSKDAFTWQSIERAAAGSDLPSTVPLKVTRVTK
jgi:uncharacterized protein (TIGR02246 family)